MMCWQEVLRFVLFGFLLPGEFNFVILFMCIEYIPLDPLLPAGVISTASRVALTVLSQCLIS